MLVINSQVLECDEGCITAIESCLEDGCSVEAMMKLDAAIAKDEKTIKARMETFYNISKYFT